MSKCIVCGGKADLLCDSYLGWERKRSEMERDAPTLRLLRSDAVPARYRAIHTCDAPLCRACAVPSGWFIAHLKGGRTLSDSTDYCPGHGRGDLGREISGLQAEAMRREWRTRFRKAAAAPGEQMELLFSVPSIP